MLSFRSSTVCVLVCGLLPENALFNISRKKSRYHEEFTGEKVSQASSYFVVERSL
jgi:hypothetical protein